MKRLYKVFLVSWLFISFNAISQQLPPVIEWQKSLGGSKIDRANSVIRTVDNGYLVVGLSFSNDGQVTGHHGSTDSSDAWVVKLDRDGNIQWQKSLGGTRNDNFMHAIQAPNGDFLCVGTTESNNGDVSGLHGLLSDLWICRLSSTGTLLWSKAYGGTDPDRGKVIRTASDGGGFVVGGDAESGDGDLTNHIGWSDFWVMKINDNGVIQWQKKFGNANHQFTNDLTVTRDGSYIVAGYQGYKGVPVCSSPVYAYYVDAYIKVDKNGNAVWERYATFPCGNPGSSTYSNGLLELPSGELFSVGHTLNTSLENYARWMFKKINPSTGQARVTFSYTSSDPRTLMTTSQGTAPNSVVMLPDSTVLSTHTGVANSFVPRVQGTLTLLSTNDAPITLYQKKYGGSNNEFFNGIEVISQSEYIVAGYSNSNDGDVSGNHGDYDAWIVKFSSLNKITGRVYVDNNGNGVKDAGENFFTNVKVSSTKNAKTITSSTNANGLFLNNVDTGTYSTTVNLLKPYFTVNPSAKISVFTTYNNKDSFDFALVPIPNKKDLKITVTSLSGLRPGFTANYRINYVNDGTEVMNGVVVKLALPFNMDFISSTPVQTSYANDTVSWNIGTLAPRATGSINLVLKGDPPPALSIGDQVTVIGIIEPIAGDETSNDNRDTLRQGTTGSFDPNDKMENRNGIMAPSQIAGNLAYTIRFQNTGNDTAFNVVIKDTLDTKLDWSSVEMVSASHNVHTSITNGNILTWTFTDILLPDSNVNEPASNGYIIYRIKPKATLVVGDTIRNSASIYFDFNLPVRTNTHQTIVRPVAVAQPSVTGLAASYCSTQGVQKGKLNNLPASGSGVTATVKLDGNAIAVAADSTFSFNVSALAAGAHVMEVSYSNGTETKTSTINFNITGAVSPQVNIGASTTNVINLLDPVIITATNAAGGGTAPTFTFAFDRNFNNILQAEGVNANITVNPSVLKLGTNKLYVRMKTSLTCYTQQTAIDSITITKYGATGIVDPDYPAQRITANPNPFKSRLMVHGINAAKAYTFTIHDQRGRKVFERRIANAMLATLNMPALPAGIYSLSIYDETKRRLIGTINIAKQ